MIRGKSIINLGLILLLTAVMITVAVFALKKPMEMEIGGITVSPNMHFSIEMSINNEISYQNMFDNRVDYAYVNPCLTTDGNVLNFNNLSISNSIATTFYFRVTNYTSSSAIRVYVSQVKNGSTISNLPNTQHFVLLKKYTTDAQRGTFYCTIPATAERSSIVLMFEKVDPFTIYFNNLTNVTTHASNTVEPAETYTTTLTSISGTYDMPSSITIKKADNSTVLASTNYTYIRSNNNKTATLTINSMPENLYVYATGVIDYWDGTTATGFSGGDGSSGSPYQITTGEQLAFIAGKTTSYFIMLNDIYLNDITNWQSWTYQTTGLNNWNPVYTGFFDGNGYEIKGLFSVQLATADSPAGFLCDVASNQTLKNLGATYGYCYSTRYSTPLVARSNYGTISNCYSNATRIATAWHAGGIGNVIEGGTVNNCYVYGSSTAPVNGAIVGVVNYSGGSLLSCFYPSGGINWVGDDRRTPPTNAGTSTYTTTAAGLQTLCNSLNSWVNTQNTNLGSNVYKQWQITAGVNNGYPYMIP